MECFIMYYIINMVTESEASDDVERLDDSNRKTYRFLLKL